MAWEKALKGFETHMQAAGKSKHTISALRTDLGKLEKAVQSEPASITATDLDHFLVEMKTKPDGSDRSSNSMNRLKTAIRSFFNWLHQSGMIESNPTTGIKTSNVSQKPPVYLTEEEEKILLRCLRDNRTKEHALRDNAIIHLMLDTGIRVAELVGLDLTDIDGKHLRVRLAKGGSPVVKFLPARTRKAVDTYIQKERPQFEKQDTFKALFINQQGTRLQARAVQLLVPAWIKLAGISKSITPHTLRHTFATSLLNKTGNLLLVQKALGHRNVTTTQIYAHVADASLEKAIEGRAIS